MVNGRSLEKIYNDDPRMRINQYLENARINRYESGFAATARLRRNRSFEGSSTGLDSGTSMAYYSLMRDVLQGCPEQPFMKYYKRRKG